jgi:hypothetical protein
MRSWHGCRSVLNHAVSDLDKTIVDVMAGTPARDARHFFPGRPPVESNVSSASCSRADPRLETSSGRLRHRFLALGNQYFFPRPNLY